MIYVADKLADDGTRDILERWADTGIVEWIDDAESCHRQAYWTDRLAADAHESGAEWIIPADIDEFVYSANGGTIADVLADCPSQKLYMRVWPHKDWQVRFQDHHPLPKVCYRWQPDAHVTMGSHEVTIAGGEYGIINMREMKYRNFSHYQQKIADRNTTLDPAARARGDGAHHLWLEQKNTEELEVTWNTLCWAPTILDPIPSHLPTGSAQSFGGQ